jgi:hypothetical protein
VAIAHRGGKESSPRAACVFAEERKVAATRDCFLRATYVFSCCRLHWILSSRIYVSRMTLAAPQPTSTKAANTSQLYLFP